MTDDFLTVQQLIELRYSNPRTVPAFIANVRDMLDKIAHSKGCTLLFGELRHQFGQRLVLTRVYVVRPGAD